MEQGDHRQNAPTGEESPPGAATRDDCAAPVPPARRRRKRLRLAFFLLFAVVFLTGLAAGGVFYAVERGLLDAQLARRAEAVMNDALGGRFAVRVGSASLRFSPRLALAVEAEDVDVSDPQNGKPVARVKAVQLVVDPVALVSGRLRIGGVDADGLDVDTALLSTDGEDVAALRIDSIPKVLDSIFTRLDAAWAFLERSQTGDIALSSLSLRFPGQETVAVHDMVLERKGAEGLFLSGRAIHNGAGATFTVSGLARDNRIVTVDVGVDDIDLAPLTNRDDMFGVLNSGLSSVADFSFSAHRSDLDGKGATLAGRLAAGPGMLHADYEAQEFSGAELNFFYDFAADKVEFTRSHLAFGRTQLPVSGAVADRDRQGDATGPGYAFDFLSSGAVSGATEAAPLVFDAKASGVFDTREQALRVDRLLATSAQGNFGGSLLVRIVPGGSPEISFGGQVPDMAGEAVLQLWPYWMARKPRAWAVENLAGGRVRNGVISVFIPAGRMEPPPTPLELGESELHIAFDTEGLRVDLPPDIPPLRDLSAHVEIRGSRAEVVATRGISYFGSGRSVTLESGRFLIAETYQKPLMAEMSVRLAGEADAIVELASFRPMNGLKNTDFRPEDFTGPVKADVFARFGLIDSQSPPAPDWKAAIVFENVALHKEIGGHRISGAQGTIDIDPARLVLASKARVEDAPLDISYLQPLGPGAGKSELKVKGQLAKAAWVKLAPELAGFVDGALAFEMEQLDPKRQAFNVDLRQASIELPWVGWSKGTGVPAQARFELLDNGEDAAIRNLQFGGDGFGANGNISFSRKGLVSGDFSRVVLSPGDDFAISVKTGRNGYDIAVSGKRVDARHIIGKMKAGYETDKPDGGDTTAGGPGFSASLKIDKLAGFNDEVLDNVSGRYAMRGGKIMAVDFTATTDTRQALVAQMLKDARNTISLTTSDAGAFARFIDLYNNMNGGLLNLRMFAMDAQSWSGSIDVRDFRLTNEQRLRSIVSTPAGAGGKSLNTALKKEIDTNSAGFQRAFARLVTRNGVLVVENGILRGDQMGATFQGTVRDRRGRMELTGTFMPAYGLNRLFAELPIIGSILGNGRDRGLIGITFKLSGKFTRPDLTVNPLSVIAPGVFRQIFEY